MLHETPYDVADPPATAQEPCLDEPPLEAAWKYFKAYSREKPEVVALWAFAVGFVLGWKLKLW